MTIFLRRFDNVIVAAGDDDNDKQPRKLQTFEIKTCKEKIIKIFKNKIRPKTNFENCTLGLN